MNPITKPNVSLTLRALEAGDHVAFHLSDVSETNGMQPPHSGL